MHRVRLPFRRRTHDDTGNLAPSVSLSGPFFSRVAGELILASDIHWCLLEGYPNEQRQKGPSKLLRKPARSQRAANIYRPPGLMLGTTSPTRARRQALACCPTRMMTPLFRAVVEPNPSVDIFAIAEPTLDIGVSRSMRT